MPVRVTVEGGLDAVVRGGSKLQVHSHRRVESKNADGMSVEEEALVLVMVCSS